MKNAADRRNKQVAFNLKEEEYRQLLKDLANTTHRTLSEYARTLVTGKPITVIYRDRSFDDFIEWCIRFKKDLDTILSHDGFTEEEKQWLSQEITTIKETMIKIYDHVRQNSNYRKNVKRPAIQSGQAEGREG
jgi:hypothetical protein